MGTPKQHVILEYHAIYVMLILKVLNNLMILTAHGGIVIRGK
jgi:hypothetical protein